MEVIKKEDTQIVTIDLTDKKFRSSISSVPKMLDLRRTIKKNSCITPLQDRPVSYGAVVLKN